MALMCDIEAMLHQVNVSEECRDVPWWENGGAKIRDDGTPVRY